MNYEELANEIVPLLKNKPLTIYELAGIMQVTPNSLYQKLKVLKALSYLRTEKDSKEIRWAIFESSKWECHKCGNNHAKKGILPPQKCACGVTKGFKCIGRWPDWGGNNDRTKSMPNVQPTDSAENT